MEKLLQVLNAIRPEVDFENERAIVSEGLIDSFDLITIVNDLDESFGISIDGEDIIPEHFENVEAMAKLLKKYDIDL